MRLRGRACDELTALEQGVELCPHALESTRSAAAMSWAPTCGVANVAFLPCRSCSVTPRAAEQPPQTWMGTCRSISLLKNSETGGQPTGTVALATTSESPPARYIVQPLVLRHRPTGLERLTEGGASLRAARLLGRWPASATRRRGAPTGWPSGRAGHAADAAEASLAALLPATRRPRAIKWLFQG